MKPHHYSCAGQVVARAKNLPSCGGDVMPRTRLRFRRAIIAFSLAALGMAGVDAVSPAFSQTPPPSVTLKVEDKTGVFEPDLADLNVTPQLQAAIKNADNWARHKDSCYPPTTFKVVVKRGGDTLFLETLAKARLDELAAKLPKLGLAKDQFKTEWEVGDSDYVQVSVPKDDKDKPKLKVTSTPPKATKVKAGDTIKVTIRASERYEDGHKSWPTGVQLIQLTADDGLVDSKDYGRVPPPCDRRTFEATYTVPKHPPPIVRLLGIATDGVGHPDSEELTFQTEDGVFPYHVVVEGSVHTQFTREPPAAALIKATLNWRAHYPKVDVRVTQYPQGVAFEPVKGDGQGTIELEFIGEFHDPYTKECAITIRLAHLAASVLVGGVSGFQRRDRWNFNSRLTDAGIQAFFDAQTSAVRAACNKDFGQGDNFHKSFHIRNFPFSTRTGRPEDETFTTADGLIWEKASLWNLDVGIEGGGGPPPLGFPLNLLKEGKPFTMSTGKRVDDPRRGSNWVEHIEGMITVTFSRP